ncbi:hypothetical protein OIV83_006330 [Microbotryomycetes sp. JL201]|nr:hypothetical protein OIV83_006330 [Microbotryomycetes sp. JL201]
MGLASKLAAAQANAASGMSPYGAPPPAQHGGVQSSSPYGQSQQSPYGAGPPGGGVGSAPGAQPYASSYGAQGPYGSSAPAYGQNPSSFYGGTGAQQQYSQNQGQTSNYGQPLQHQQPQPQQYGAQYGQPQQQYGQPGHQYGQPGQQHGQPGQQYGQPSIGAGQPQQYGGAAPNSQPGQQQYGTLAPGAAAGYGPPQQHYGAAPSGGPSAEVIATVLQTAVVDQKLQAFYPPGSLQQIAENVARSGALQRIASDWSIPMEIAIDLARLALFDVILYLDDSGSMAFEENGSRIEDLKLIVNKVATASAMFDSDGIQVRFMNSTIEGNNINSEASVANMFQSVKFSGLTPLGTALNQKILEPLVLGPARQNRLQKPVLIVVVTDGAPGGEDRNTLARVIVNASRELARTRYGPDALSIQLSQVGNDLAATAFLNEIDRHPEVGSLVDCLSPFEIESVEFEKANKGVGSFSPILWIVKLLLGPISSEYDSKDE